MTSLITFFLKGIVIGFSVAAIPGPIGVLCIRRTLINGLYIGIILGLGAAVANSLFALIAGFGIASVSSILIKYHVALNMVGGMFLGYLGIKTFLTKPAVNVTTAQENGALKAFALTFLLTVTNPMTILYFAAIIASTGIVLASNDYLVASALVGGVFFGSVAWFVLLCCISASLRSKINAAVLNMINKVSGLLIIGFALYVFLSAFKK